MEICAKTDVYSYRRGQRCALVVLGHSVVVVGH
jgi:hypothetical protein